MTNGNSRSTPCLRSFILRPLLIGNRIICLGSRGAGLSLLLYSVAAASSQPEATGNIQDIFASSTPVAIAFMISILLLKITAFVLGYFIVRMGHDTLIKGVSGEIDFGFSGSGVSAKLKSASPGALFVLLGSAIIIWGLVVQKPMDIRVTPPAETGVGSTENKKDAQPPKKLPKVPD